MKSLFCTERLQAYVVHENLASAYLAYEKRNRKAFAPYSVPQVDSYYTLASFKDVCDRQQMLYQQAKMLPLLFFAKGQSNHIVATVSLNQMVWGIFRSAKIGYSVEPELQGQGFGTEAVGSTIAYAFNTFGMHRIEAHIQEQNIPSLALAAKLGFLSEGIARGYLYRNGEWVDHLRLALLNTNLDMLKFK